jgi:hypothetical protein
MARHALRLCAGAIILTLVPAGPSAQTPEKRTPEQIRASYEAHKGDFDYLLGDWEFTADSKQWGKLRGYWSAVRLHDGQILDEYRVVGDDGETYYVTSSLRNYNGVLDRWELVGADAGTGLQDVGTGRKVGPEMHIEQKFGVMSDSPSLWKIRYYNIRPESFSWAADRSTDGGKTWQKDHQTIQARRIGPPRTLSPLAPARNADPISGLWMDDAGRGAGLDLRYDGKSAVTGKLLVTGRNPNQNPAIRKGTFDPTTGTLKLEGEDQRPDGTIGKYVIEGKVDKNTLSGTFAIGTSKGTFTFTKKK